MSDPTGGFRPLGRGPSFTLANKLERVAFACAWLLLARWTPPQAHRWRRWLLQRFGAQIGAGARIYASVRIWLPRNLRIGADTLVGPGAELYNQGAIIIGPRCVISQRAVLCASTHRVSDPDFELVLRPITLGAACWIAAEAFVGPGVQMGDGAVLGARGALFEDAATMGIYRGNPAVLLKERRFNPPR
jgi:putative colanic acid biosynthesis acetyltransferase WcaF